MSTLLEKTIKAIKKAPDDERLAFWNVMTALRGPDNGSCELKRWYTSYIRGAIGLNIAHCNRPYNDWQPPLAVREELEQERHFRNHIRDAFYTLSQLKLLPECYTV